MTKKAWLLVMMAQPMAVYASDLGTAQAIQNKTNTASAQSQTRISHSADSTLSLRADIEQLEEEVKNLDVYRKHLEALVKDQHSELSNIDQQISDIEQTRQGVVPLMYKMIDGLKQTVKNDKPIRIEQRNLRIEKLETMMTVANVSDAEKYRRILEAYQIELDYGIKLGVYQGKITLDDDKSIEANILYLGRISLIARNFNQDKYWAWDQKEKAWVLLDSSLNSDLNHAYAVANKEVAPSLLTLPVSLNITEEK
ncbi:DUF3450 domain-containing protein [Aliivibrio sifiae]|uniref:DUF3450 domain-containing protein n=3 Tax=Aliivibrio sifiae TaxID=566293 RepID=A0A2S7X8R9_9GAMM|nr:DUF3450 domain-containing protein [Aliivibrio sifiae]PQJ87667.1 hypothetical protein BTO23_16355 [Aliivibrio sifiae]